MKKYVFKHKGNMGKRKSERIKILAVREYYKGEKVSNICKKYNCAKSTFYSWINLYKETRTQYGTVTPKDLDNAKRRIRLLQNELEILRSSTPFKALTTKEKEYEIDNLYGKYSVYALCDAFCLSKGTYYNHRLHSRGKDAWFEKRKIEIGAKVRKIFDDSRQTYGAIRIHKKLVESGEHVSYKYVLNIMKELGLVSVHSICKENRKITVENRKADLLRQSFDVDEKNKVWVSDMSSFDLRGRRMYICVYLDLFSRKVLSYRLGRVPSTNLAMATIKEAIREEKPERGLIVHTDNGGAYVSYSMNRLASHYGFALSYSRPGHPHDNAVAESFFSLLKKEFIWRYTFKGLKNLSNELEKYISFYNKEHSYDG